jgi:hypothetical protein
LFCSPVTDTPELFCSPVTDAPVLFCSPPLGTFKQNTPFGTDKPNTVINQVKITGF